MADRHSNADETDRFLVVSPVARLTTSGLPVIMNTVRSRRGSPVAGFTRPMNAGTQPGIGNLAITSTGIPKSGSITTMVIITRRATGDTTRNL